MIHEDVILQDKAIALVVQIVDPEVGIVGIEGERSIQLHLLVSHGTLTRYGEDLVFGNERALAHVVDGEAVTRQNGKPGGVVTSDFIGEVLVSSAPFEAADGVLEDDGIISDAAKVTVFDPRALALIGDKDAVCRGREEMAPGRAHGDAYVCVSLAVLIDESRGG